MADRSRKRWWRRRRNGDANYSNCGGGCVSGYCVCVRVCVCVWLFVHEGHLAERNKGSVSTALGKRGGLLFKGGFPRRSAARSSCASSFRP